MLIARRRRKGAGRPLIILLRYMGITYFVVLLPW